MSKAHSTHLPVQGKPTKPTPDYPLFPHATGRWAKKIRGRMVYFGPWSDPDEALAKYLAEKNDLHAGKTPADTSAEGLAVYQLCAKFLASKKLDREGGLLSPRTFNEYGKTCASICKVFSKQRLVSDLRPADFEKLRSRWVKQGWGPVTVSGEIQRVRTLFKYGYDNDLMEKPVRFGSGFRKPGKKTMRLVKAAKGKQMFTAKEIRAMLPEASAQLKAMILLGINAGLGNGDCGKLTQSALDLENGWLDFPRPKTGIPRRCPLWPETITAIQEALANRPLPKDAKNKGLVFITKYGEPWFKVNIDNPVSKEMRKLLDKIDIKGGRNFYCLRRGFETVGGGSRDQVAVDHIMGHSHEDMAETYRQGIEDDRLQAVAEHVRQWLFAEPEADEPPDVLPMKRAGG